MKKLLCSALAVLTVFGLAACGKKDNTTTEENLDLILSGDYTYNSYTEALGTNWNPHSWEMNADDAMLSYVSVGFLDMSIKDSKKGEYQWVYEMATEIKDVTAQNQADLTKFKSTLPAGKTADQITEGYVYQIKLNPNAKWENGEAINADSYVESMKRLLSPDFLNYRANLYIAGESAIAGAYKYYYSRTEGLYVTIGSQGYKKNADAVAAGEKIYIDAHDSYGAAGYTDKDGNLCPQWLAFDDETVYQATWAADATEEDKDAFSGKDLWDYLFNPTNGSYKDYVEVGVDYESWLSLYRENADFDENMTYDDTVGLYKVDDYTINYVLSTTEDINYFFTSMTSTWLVYTPLYDQLTKQTGKLKTTTYGSSKETTMSYGPYKLDSFQDEKQAVFVRNPYWYGYQKSEDGYLYSVTNFLVDGGHKQQYIANKIVIDVLTPAAAEQKFMKGEVDEWAPTPEKVPEYTLSSQMYKVDETYTMRLFFNTDPAKLAAMDAEGNQNSVVMTSYKFRKAMSLSFDRADYVTATEGYKPATFLMNTLYFYDIFNDPSSSYRSSQQAMKSIVDFYGYEYGEGKQYATLEEAYEAVTGYNLTEAKALMKEACDELVAAGKYTKGSKIVLQLAWKKAAMQAADYAQVNKLQAYLNAAAEGSGFGEIELKPLGNLADRYGDVIKGIYCIGYGAWGGAAFYPFRNFQVYMDPDQYELHEAGCWNPATETVTLTVKGKEETMTWQQWSNCMVGTGKYADADFDTKLEITAQLETKFMDKYYCIPLATTCVASLLSYKLNYYTEDYNIMYGFGGLRLAKFNYNDAEWAAYVQGQGGTLNYK